MNGKKACKLSIGKSKALPRKKEQGFTLITVLLLSSLASILVLNSLKDNVNQERLSGNFQKEINARLASEQGIFASITTLSEALADNQNATIAELLALGVQNGSTDLGRQTGHATLNHGGMTYKVALSETTPGELLLISEGNRFEGKKVLKARLTISQGGGGSPFSDAVSGCDGINLGGSGQIDSYDSSDSSTITYTTDRNGNQSVVTTRGSKGHVSTITKADPDASPPILADIVLGGNSPIYGDLNATGGIDTNTSNVDGNLHANGNIMIGNGSGIRITGNVLTQGDYHQKGGKIAGHVRANGDAEMKWTTYILNDVNDGLDILYGGADTFQNDNSEYRKTKYNIFPNVEKVKDSDVTAPGYDAADPETNCDHLNITDKIDLVANGASSLPTFTGLSTSTFTFTESLGSAEGHYTGNGDSTSFLSSDEDVLGETLPVIKLASFTLSSDAKAIIKGDVTLYVEGDFTVTGGAKMTIEAGSSLTLLIKGKVTISGGGKIESLKHGFTSTIPGRKSRPTMSIYSSYASVTEHVRRDIYRYTDYGFQTSGAGELYAAIYAPLAFADIGAGTTLYGSIRAKRVTVTGGSAIHYDAALGDADRGGSYSATAKLSFLGFKY